jgi:hypothetical protein
MELTPARCPGAAVLAVTLFLGLVPNPAEAQGPAPGFVPGRRALFDLSLEGVPVGELPRQIRLLKGNLEVAQKDGTPMLKASDVTEFLVPLPEFLPENFTVEFDLVPKACCNPEDLSFEGTRAINQGVASALIAWDSDGSLTVQGGGDAYDAPMPEDFKVSLPSVLTSVAVSFAGPTVKMYTNGKRLYTLTDRRFVRGKVLRVLLGGQDDATQAVHLARLRVATDDPPAEITAGGFTPGSRTLFELDMQPDSLGTFPKQLKALKGSMAVVMKDGVKILKATNTSEFLVPLPQALPADFTVEFEVIPKECCNPHDLGFEGTPAIDQGDASTYVQWYPDVVRAIGGGETYDSKVPEGLALTLPLALTHVSFSAEAGTLKLYTNGRRQFTFTDRKFARGKVLRVFLGGQDADDQAVYLARLRIATNTP